MWPFKKKNLKSETDWLGRNQDYFIGGPAKNSPVIDTIVDDDPSWSGLQLEPAIFYTIDWDKIKSIKDLKIILKNLDLVVDIKHCSEELKPYLIKR